MSPDKHNGTAAVVHAVAEGGPDRRVIYLERRYLQPAFIENHFLINVLGEDNDAVGRRPIVIEPHPDVDNCMPAPGATSSWSFPAAPRHGAGRSRPGPTSQPVNQRSGKPTT